ncbi:MAG: putative toxin-antitoxin system toxin component, PIN family [Firmicutes bacterium]|nr:putative toxin-antitoxin system toxin component, PIN family [Bacillota bacterium]
MITLDTNVLFQALYSNQGASFRILDLIRHGELELAISVPVFEEYCDVLLRKENIDKFQLTKENIETVLAFIAYIGKPFIINYLLRPNLKDEDDNIFMELAFVSNSKYLITSNIRDFTIGNELRLDSFQIITPSDFYKKWRFNHE